MPQLSPRATAAIASLNCPGVRVRSTLAQILHQSQQGVAKKLKV
ncbi:hypothetical protein [Phormidesmis priestleyi]|nr:hypothetical protein [Phormidesmis priestleyi]